MYVLIKFHKYHFEFAIQLVEEQQIAVLQKLTTFLIHIHNKLKSFNFGLDEGGG